jgi:hypothetical protein
MTVQCGEKTPVASSGPSCQRVHCTTGIRSGVSSTCMSVIEASRRSTDRHSTDRHVPPAQCGEQDSAASDGGRDHLAPRILPLQSVLGEVRCISEEHRSSQHIMVEEQMVPFMEEAVRTARGREADRGNSKDKLRRSAVGPVGIVRHRVPSQPEVLAGCSPEL